MISVSFLVTWQGDTNPISLVATEQPDYHACTGMSYYIAS